MTAYTFVVLTNPVPGREDEYNSWYTDQHMPDVLKVEGVAAAQRFKLADDTAEATFRYCALYQIETDDAGAVIAELGRRAGTPAMPMSSALDTNLSATLFRAITPLVRA
jgi:hypothetical protein